MTKLIAAVVAIVGALIAGLGLKIKSQEKEIDDAKIGEVEANTRAMSSSELDSALAKDLGRDTPKS